jgi:hypothetical protein
MKRLQVRARKCLRRFRSKGFNIPMKAFVSMKNHGLNVDLLYMWSSFIAFTAANINKIGQSCSALFRVGVVHTFSKNAVQCSQRSLYMQNACVILHQLRHAANCLHAD